MATTVRASPPPTEQYGCRAVASRCVVILAKEQALYQRVQLIEIFRDNELAFGQSKTNGTSVLNRRDPRRRFAVARQDDLILGAALHCLHELGKIALGFEHVDSAH